MVSLLGLCLVVVECTPPHLIPGAVTGSGAGLMGSSAVGAERRKLGCHDTHPYPHHANLAPVHEAPLALTLALVLVLVPMPMLKERVRMYGCVHVPTCALGTVKIPRLAAV